MSSIILFENDWRRFPTALPDYDTKNKSFLDLVELYDKMGVKNCLFPLALYNPMLKGVDPHDPDLDFETKMMIGQEVLVNPWYSYRECARVPSHVGVGGLPLEANRGNIALFWLFHNHIDTALIQIRQTGKSLNADIMFDDLMFIRARGALISMITKDDTLREENIIRLKKIRDAFPPYLIPTTKKDKDNTFELTCVELKNRYRAGVAQASESGANKLGRGFSTAILQIDEGPFCNNIGITIPAITASGNAVIDEARLYGRPYGTVYTTTAGKKDDKNGKFMHDMIYAGAPWTEQFFDAKDPTELLQMISNNKSGRKVLVNCTFNHRQLGKTDEWLYDKIARLPANTTPADIERDFFNKWTSGSLSSPLPAHINDTIFKSEREPTFIEISKDKYMINWYITREELDRRVQNHSFVMGMDTSDAVGSDAITATIIDITDMSTVGTFMCNETNLIRFGSFVADFLIKYKNIVLIPERRSSGQTIIDTLLIRLPAEGIDPFKRIYNTIVNESSERPDLFNDISLDMGRRMNNFYDVRKRFFGFATSSGSREKLYVDTLQNVAARVATLVWDKTLSHQIRGLVERNGRIDHQASGNDDMVISWLLAHWLLLFGKRLDYYGIETRLIDTRRIVYDDRPIQDIRKEQEQQDIQRELRALIDEWSDCPDEMKAARLEHHIRVLTSRVTENSEATFSLDALIKEISERKQMERMRIHGHGISIDRNAVWGHQQTQRQMIQNATNIGRWI